MAAVQPMWKQTLPATEILPDAAGSVHEDTAAQAQTGPRGIEPTGRHLGSAVNSHTFKLSILMYAYNDDTTVSQAIREVLKVDYPCDIELIIVDDGSTESMHELLSQINDARLITYRHKPNQAGGAAPLSAASLATGSYVLLFNADLDYSAEDIPRILAPVLADRCSVVYGTLLCGYNTMRRSYRYARGSRLLTWLANVLFDACITDLHACLKLIPVGMLDGSAFREPGFGFETELTAILLKQGIRPFEVPVSYYGCQYSPDKKNSWRQAITFIRILLQVRLRRSQVDLRVHQRLDHQGYGTAVAPRDHPLFPRRVDAV
jgi:dolichol-phosphate hexosyltransferase